MLFFVFSFFSRCISRGDDVFGMLIKPHPRDNFTEGTKLVIYDSLFLDLHHRSSENLTGGGAIAGNRRGYRLVIDRCAFLNCSSNGPGGAIHFRAPGGASRVACVVGSYCDSGEMNGNFALLATDGDSENILNLSSSSFCGYRQHSKGTAPVSIAGSAVVGYDNSSMNDCFMKSGLEARLYPIISFSIFVDNAATDGHCLSFDGAVQMMSCNVIKNFQLNTFKGVVKCVGNGDFILKNCFISENSNGKTVECSGTKFSMHNCFVNKFSSDADVQFENNESLEANQITFFVNNSDVKVRIRAPKKKTKQIPITIGSAAIAAAKKAKIRIYVMFILLAITVICAGLISILQNYDDELPEEEPLVKGKKKKQGLSAMNAIV